MVMVELDHSLSEKVLSDKQLPHLISRAMISSLKGSVAAIITETARSLLHIEPHIRIPIVTLAGLTPPIWEHTKWYLIDRTRILNPEQKGI